MLDMILDALVPVFFVMALGFLAGWMRDIDNRHVAELTALVMDFAIPASLFVATVRTPRAQLLQYGTLIAVLAVSMLAIYGLTFLLQRSVFKLDARQAAIGALTVAFPNVASIGLPLIDSVFGAANAVSVGLSIAVGSILLSPLTLVLLETGQPSAGDAGPGHVARSIGKSILKPIVLAPLIGMLLSLAGVALPELLASSLTLIGVGSGGVALFLTGLILSSQPFKPNANVLSGTLLKNVAQPLLAAGLVMAVVAPPTIGREAILLSAVPSGFFGILFGLRYGVVSLDAASTLIASSLLSVLTLPIVMVLSAGTQ